jgi:hypothetical protein
VTSLCTHVWIIVHGETVLTQSDGTDGPEFLWEHRSGHRPRIMTFVSETDANTFMSDWGVDIGEPRRVLAALRELT